MTGCLSAHQMSGSHRQHKAICKIPEIEQSSVPSQAKGNRVRHSQYPVLSVPQHQPPFKVSTRLNADKRNAVAITFVTSFPGTVWNFERLRPKNFRPMQVKSPDAKGVQCPAIIGLNDRTPTVLVHQVNLLQPLYTAIKISAHTHTHT